MTAVLILVRNKFAYGFALNYWGHLFCQARRLRLAPMKVAGYLLALSRGSGPDALAA